MHSLFLSPLSERKYDSKLVAPPVRLEFQVNNFSWLLWGFSQQHIFSLKRHLLSLTPPRAVQHAIWSCRKWYPWQPLWLFSHRLTIIRFAHDPWRQRKKQGLQFHQTLSSELSLSRDTMQLSYCSCCPLFISTFCTVHKQRELYTFCLKLLVQIIFQKYEHNFILS